MSDKLTSNTKQCRICGEMTATPLGKIPDCCEFSGQLVDTSIKGGWLWYCKTCNSMFRHPTLSSDEYLSFYKRLPQTVWQEGENTRQDFSTIYSYLVNHVGGKILDVGCFTGNFLAGLSNQFKKFGLEPSMAASFCAETKGIHVLGKTLDELDPKIKFDVITAIDVVEHILNVEDFLAQAFSHVKENGLLIIASGDPDTKYWKRLFKSRYWYSVFPEHVSFPSYKYFCDFSARSKLPPPERVRFRYTNLKYWNRFSMFLHQVLFYLSPLIYRFMYKTCRTLIKRHVSIHNDVSVIAAGVFIDHQIIVFSKKE